MLGQGKVCATIAVKDLAAAREFYGGTLGLRQEGEVPGGVKYASQEGKIFVYQSEYAGTNRATYAEWQVEDVEAVVEDLKAKGVNFEHYDMPDTEWQGDIAVMGPMKTAWFKDPDGNILAVDNGGGV